MHSKWADYDFRTTITFIGFIDFIQFVWPPISISGSGQRTVIKSINSRIFMIVPKLEYMQLFRIILWGMDVITTRIWDSLHIQDFRLVHFTALTTTRWALTVILDHVWLPSLLVVRLGDPWLSSSQLFHNPRGFWNPWVQRSHKGAIDPMPQPPSHSRWLVRCRHC